MAKKGAREPPSHEMDRVDLGFGGLSASIGDHIGHLYQTREEWRTLLVGFLAAGLQTPDNKCVYFTNGGETRREIEDGLAATGVDVASMVASGQLVLGEASPTPEEMRDRLNRALAEVPERFRLVRWGGDMTWSLGKVATSEVLMEWETMCNVIEAPQAVFLCQYDLHRFVGSVIIDALRSHPLSIIGSTIHQNQYYQDPETFLTEIRSRPSTPLAH